MTPAAVLIGVGNPWRRDDGVGSAVVTAAGRLLGDAVEVVEVDGEPSRLLDAWTDVDLAVVVDAAQGDAPPGTIHVWRDNSPIDRTIRPSGSHALGVADAIALGRALQRLPRSLVVIGVEVADTSPGHGLSPAVAAGVDAAVAVVVEVVQAGSKATSSAGE